MQVDNTSIYHELNQIKKIKNSPYNRAMQRRKFLHGITFLIAIFSGMNMFSASFFERYFVIKKHLMFLSIGYLMAFFSVLIFDKNRSKVYRFFENSSIQYLIMALSCILLVIVGAIAENVKGAKVWLYIGGISIQPAEILKIAFIINIAHFLRLRCEAKTKSLYTLLGLCIFGILYCGPISFIQNDTGTALHYIAIAGFMVFMSNVNKKWIMGIIGAGVTALAVGFYTIYQTVDVDQTKAYSLRRIKGYLVGLLFGDYSSDVSHQVGQGLIAFGSGGIAGKGYGNGVQKYSYIPEVHTDFIMSSFGEEFGFIGMLVLCIAFYGLFHTIMKVAEDSSDLFGRYIVIGIAGMIMTQFFINLFVATGLFPVFGIPMPFFSSGGTSVITLFVGISLVQMINNASLTKK